MSMNASFEIVAKTSTHHIIRIVYDGWIYLILQNCDTGAETLLQKEQKGGMVRC